MSPLLELRNLPAVAKINHYLHVTGRRDNGYHELETLFQFIDLADYLDLSLRTDGQINRINPLNDVPPEQDLCVRAARALQNASGTELGANINLEKNLPMGAGLGGGSSDAATVLLGLNRLWGLNWPRKQLAQLGLSLGADVPVFVMGRNAYATGVGEQLTPVVLPQLPLVLVIPPVSVPTQLIFSDPELTRCTKPLKIMGFSRGQKHLLGRNDLEPIACQLFEPVKHALQVLSAAAALSKLSASRVRMSGSGACVFALCDNQNQAQAIVRSIAEPIGKVIITRTLQASPM
jgi:4-diphosphocytidyl-2-C-methyl-D-erythritol kinase